MTLGQAISLVVVFFRGNPCRAFGFLRSVCKVHTGIMAGAIGVAGGPGRPAAGSGIPRPLTPMHTLSRFQHSTRRLTLPSLSQTVNRERS